MPVSQKKRTPAWILWSILIFFTGLIMFVSAELVLRIVPGQWSNPFFYVYDPIVGTWHLPNISGDNVQLDYAVRGIHFNSFGMRDKERTLAKKPGVTRIAVLGDSFVEAIQVADDQTFTAQMEQQLGGKVEVLNFGVGGFGTAQELMTYRTKVRQFKPDIVILAFLSGNDMRNNNQPLESLYNGGGYREMPFPQRQADGSWKLLSVPSEPASSNPIVLFCKRHFALYRFLWFEKNRLQADFGTVPGPASATTTAATSTTETHESPDVYLTRLFAPPSKESQIFKDAWDGTDWLIGELAKDVQADGAQFVLVTEPDEVHMERDPRAALEKQYGAPLPAVFDIDYPEWHLKMLSEDKGYSFLDLTPAFRAYRDAHDMQPPYFSHAHDGHWAPIGHTLAAQTIVSYLEDKGLLKP